MNRQVFFIGSNLKAPYASRTNILKIWKKYNAALKKNSTVIFVMRGLLNPIVDSHQPGTVKKRQYSYKYIMEFRL